MACDLELQCNFLYGFFTCNLPEDTVDVEYTICTLKGIHTFRRDCNIQASVCSPWGMLVRLFPSIRKKMKEYIKERQSILNPLAPNREFPNRPVPHHSWKSPKAPQPKEVTQKADVTLRNLEEEIRDASITKGVSKPKQQRPHPRI